MSLSGGYMKYFLILISLFQLLYSQYIYKNITAIGNDKYLFADEFNKNVYIYEQGKFDVLISFRGAGEYFNIDTSLKIIAFKHVDDNDDQIPVIFNYENKTYQSIYPPCDLISQIGILSDNSFYLAHRDTLIIYQNNHYVQYLLKDYSNQIVHHNNFFYYITKDNKIYCFSLENKNNYLLYDGKNEESFFNPLILNGKLFFQTIANNIYALNLQDLKKEFIAKGKNIKIVDNDKISFTEYVFNNDTLEKVNIIEFNLLTKEKKLLYRTNRNLNFILYQNKIVFIENQNSESYFKILNIDDKSLIQETIIPHYKSSRVFKSKPGNNQIISNIPFVHQNNDTPDWHWGRSSCASATAMMIIGYYNVLPEWPYKVSYPSSHISKWGGYIADKYIFNGQYYTTPKDVYNGSVFKNTCYGAHAYMWTNGSPYSKMANFYRNHGFTATQTDLPNYLLCENEVNQGYPLTFCVMLTTSGHVILGKGIYKTGTFIFNDPYGDKNLQPQYGYPNKYGENTYYDWPGYNNGYVNLDVNAGTNAGVAWIIQTRFNKLPIADTLVDDLQFNYAGFNIKTNIPQVLTQSWDYMFHWKNAASGGYNKHYWYANTTSNELQEASWKPTLPQDGIYDIYAYIPSTATATDVTYKITTKQGVITIPFNQKNNKGKWALLGRFELDKNNALLTLSNASSVNNEIVTFDAVKFSFVENITSLEKGNSLDEISIDIYPNPFNSSTQIRLKGNTFDGSYSIYDITGRMIENKKIIVNNSNIILNMNNFPAGFYLVNFQFGKKIISRKILLIK